MRNGVVNQAFTSHGFISDFDSKEEALQIIPPLLRHNANIIELVKFTKKNIAEFANSVK